MKVSVDTVNFYQFLNPLPPHKVPSSSVQLHLHQNRQHHLIIISTSLLALKMTDGWLKALETSDNSNKDDVDVGDVVVVFVFSWNSYDDDNW